MAGWLGISGTAGTVATVSVGAVVVAGGVAGVVLFNGGAFTSQSAKTSADAVALPVPEPVPEPLPEPLPEPVSNTEPAPGSDDPVAAAEASEGDTEPPATAEPETAGPTPPSFDIVSVDAQGNAVMAGRAEPRSVVAVLIDGEEAHRAQTDAGGSFAAIFAVPVVDTPQIVSLMMEVPGREAVGSQESVILAPPPARLAEPGAGPNPVDSEIADAPDRPTGLPDAVATPAPPVALTPEIPAPVPTERPALARSDLAALAPSQPQPDAAVEVPDQPLQDPAASALDGAALPPDPVPDSTAAAFAEATDPSGEVETPVFVASGEPATAAPDATDAASAGSAAPAATPTREAPPTALAAAPGLAPGVDARDVRVAGLDTEPSVDIPVATLPPEAASAPEIAENEVSGTSPPAVLQSGSPGLQDPVAVNAATQSRGVTDLPEAEIPPIPEPAQVAVVAAPSALPDVTEAIPPTEVALGGTPNLTMPSSDAAERPSVDSGVTIPRPNLPATPRAPTVLLADDTGLRVLEPVGAAPNVAESVVIDTITYDPDGGVALGGRGAGSGFVRIYIDNQPIKTTRIGVDGQWRTPLPEVDTGVYTLRIDELAEDGAVVSRVETPFQREEPARVAALDTRSGGTRPGLGVVTVQPGNTLWGLATDSYGDGMLYVRLFRANRDRIRNPDLIYPGQIFSIPEG